MYKYTCVNVYTYLYYMCTICICVPYAYLYHVNTHVMYKFMHTLCMYRHNECMYLYIYIYTNILYVYMSILSWNPAKTWPPNVSRFFFRPKRLSVPWTANCDCMPGDVGHQTFGLDPVDPLFFYLNHTEQKHTKWGWLKHIAFMTSDNRFRFFQLVFARFCLSIQSAVNLPLPARLCWNGYFLKFWKKSCRSHQVVQPRFRPKIISATASQILVATYPFNQIIKYRYVRHFSVNDSNI